MKRLTKPLAVIILVVLGVILGGIVTAKAAISDDIGVRWWRMNKAHEGAEIARALGGDNSAALAYFGERWTTAGRAQADGQIFPGRHAPVIVSRLVRLSKLVALDNSPLRIAALLPARGAGTIQIGRTSTLVPNPIVLTGASSTGTFIW